ncbi:hypothetical protein ACWCPX_34615 [Streptomyces olivaceoviridis]
MAQALDPWHLQEVDQLGAQLLGDDLRVGDVAGLDPVAAVGPPLRQAGLADLRDARPEVIQAQISGLYL